MSRYVNEDGDPPAMLNRFQDFIWGDRLGHENAQSLKALSNSFTEPELLCVLPHFRDSYFAANTPVPVENGINSTSILAPDMYARVKGLFAEKGDVTLLDVGRMLLREARARNWTYQQSLTASAADSETSFTIDGTHQNTLGAKVIARYLAPIFDIEQVN